MSNHLWVQKATNLFHANSAFHQKEILECKISLLYNARHSLNTESKMKKKRVRKNEELNRCTQCYTVMLW